jgi:hypothetical protein
MRTQELSSFIVLNRHFANLSFVFRPVSALKNRRLAPPRLFATQDPAPRRTNGPPWETPQPTKEKKVLYPILCEKSSFLGKVSPAGTALERGINELDRAPPGPAKGRGPFDPGGFT